MLIFVLDDEPRILEDTRAMIEKVEPLAEIRAFTRPKAALAAVTDEGLSPDIVFSDIEMPGMKGLVFARKLKTLCPFSRIVFVTGYEQYALEAFRVRAQGYLLKPVREEALREELSYVPHEDPPPRDKLVVKCFGHFDIFWRGKPVVFQRKQSKELFAYLVDREGAACSSGEIALALWDEWTEREAELNRIRVLVNDIRSTLKLIGMEAVLTREHRLLAVRRELLDCDYYKMLEGDMDAVNSYHGEYMTDYSWADLKNDRLASL